MAADAVTQVATHTSAHQQSIRYHPQPRGTWVVRGWRLHCASTAGDRAVAAHGSQVPPDRVGAL